MRLSATMLLVLLSVGVLAVGGCGQKGELYRETGPTPERTDEDRDE